MIRAIPAADAACLALGQLEIGFLDVREAAPFSEGHPLFAAHAPYSALEARIGTLVPRCGVPLIIIDGGDGIGVSAAERLQEMGYEDIMFVEGGTSAWAASGFNLFKGVNVPSKTLGELVQERWRPCTIDSDELARWRQEGKRFSFFDCRPPSEHERMTIPGANCLPSAEIAHRLPMLDQEGPMLLTCAGRTRGIIGVTGLLLAAPGREYLALENGTQGWALSGRELEPGSRSASHPTLSQEAATETRRRADAFLEKTGIQVVDAQRAKEFQRDPEHTTYFVDVRSETETEADPLQAFDQVPAGQLIQTIDSAVAVLRSRVVLADDLGLRAALAAFWLRALGRDAFVARIDNGIRAMEPPDRPRSPSFRFPESNASECLAEMHDGTATLLDLRSSSEFSKVHVAGSRWTIRPFLRELPKSGRWLIAGDEGPLANLGAIELARLGRKDFALVRGGFAALREAGAKLEENKPLPFDKAIDLVSFGHGRHDGDLNASRQYLEWEMGLVSQLSTGERAAFAM